MKQSGVCGILAGAAHVSRWANRSGTAFICDRCGFVHTFAGGEFELWAPDNGYPG